MTRSTNKPKRHPTFTLDELRALLHAVVTCDTRAMTKVARSLPVAQTKIANAIAYREDEQQRAKL